MGSEPVGLVLGEAPLDQTDEGTPAQLLSIFTRAEMRNRGIATRLVGRAEEELHRRERLKLAGYGLEELAVNVAGLFDIEPARIFKAGKYPRIVQARGLFCYWAVRELGWTATTLAKKLHISQPAVSMAVKRGELLAREGEYTLPVERDL